MASIPNAFTARPVLTLDDVGEPSVRAWIEEAVGRPETLGFLLCGSRTLGWAAPDGDYDGFLYVTDGHYQALGVDQTEIRLFAEGETPKRMIGEFSLISDTLFGEHLQSPLDVDHWPYIDAVVINDKSRALEAWRRRISAFPEGPINERAMHKYIQLVVAYHYATIDDVRGFAVDRQLNLYRAALAGVNLWFTLQRRWAPPFKWWTREVERLGIRPDTRAVLEGAILNPTVEMLTHLRDHLKTEMKVAGIAEVDDVLLAFFTTLRLEHRPKVYRNSYL